MIGLHLLLGAVAVAVTAPRVLAGAGWAQRCPRLGIAAWFAALAAVGTAALGGLVAFMAPWQAGNAPVCTAWRWCLQAAEGGYGVAGRLASYGVLILAGMVVARMVATIGRAARAGARRRRDHVRTLDLAGRAVPDLGATVVEHPRPAAYVVAGRRRRVVVTTGALYTLSVDELAAVLGHERAHAAGRHDLIVDGIRLLQQAFPNSSLLACARSELGRLVEMHADDVVTRTHQRISLARALVAMTATTGSTAEPVPLLAATGGDALARMNRLLDPPAPLHRAHRWAVAVALALGSVAPLALLVAAHAFPALGVCPTLS